MEIEYTNYVLVDKYTRYSMLSERESFRGSFEWKLIHVSRSVLSESIRIGSKLLTRTIGCEFTSTAWKAFFYMRFNKSVFGL